ncbi:hypothetical protein R7D97_25420 [Vibrio sp. Vb5031]|uniref:MarR family transcriptional regulator n=1 Tax=Vibrio hepatarius TaxID=171383 RepID=A0A0M0HT09_9VIBR|nr:MULTISPECIES: hypothetical protein [Vibrio]KOO05211.1 hypothetical protein AKJ31_21655 [Vibrio hepatarius]MCR9821741.1 hypothetical protein [Vibrio parahaemolyticus]MDW1507528.1 hypothetical protein [Vibrio sp. Vb5031]MDW1517860.1 hypothetical protein [Vibrio sp. Vb5035]MDW1548025.1 hypothetical protein [Vibrio sp. Vb5034]
MVSAWLGAISALDRRLGTGNMTLKEYMTIAYVHEQTSVSEEDLAMFATHNEDSDFGNSIINRLLEAGHLTRDEDTNAIIISEHGHHVIDEVHRLCKSRLIQPIFTNPN